MIASRQLCAAVELFEFELFARKLPEFESNKAQSLL